MIPAVPALPDRPSRHVRGDEGPIRVPEFANERGKLLIFRFCELRPTRSRIRIFGGTADRRRHGQTSPLIDEADGSGPFNIRIRQTVTEQSQKIAQLFEGDDEVKYHYLAFSDNRN
jgi:hypothetical protein